MTIKSITELVIKDYVKAWKVRRGFYYTQAGQRRDTHTLVVEHKPGGVFKSYVISKALFDELSRIAPGVEFFTEEDALKLGVKPVRVAR